MNKVFKLLRVAFLLPLLTGCTQEETGGCPNATVTFEYTGDESTDIFRKHIANVAYYVYDASGNRVASGRLESAELADFRGFKLKLDRGTYEVVCWGNLEHYCRADREDRKETARIINPEHLADADPRTNDPLYYGKASLEIGGGDTPCTATVKFRSAHITLWMYTKGVEDRDPDGQLRTPVFHVGGFDSEYDFDGNSNGMPMSFRPEAVYKEERKIGMARCEVPRFSQGTPAILKVFQGSDHKLLEVVQIGKFVADNHIETEQSEEVEIPILLDFMGLEVVVRMPTWDEVDVAPEW